MPFKHKNSFSFIPHPRLPAGRPHAREELALRKQGHNYIAGVDEAGRGSWAGPLVAAAVILPPDFAARQVNDSKKMTEQQREKMFVHVTRNALSWAVCVVPPEFIDQRGMTAANKKALVGALQKLHIRPQAILVDAVKIKYGKKPVKAIIGGDGRVLSIAAASIVAKVVRDVLMGGIHRQYPQYDFHIHKGYGTPRHVKLLELHGPSPVHRRSFKPVKEIIRGRKK